MINASMTLRQVAFVVCTAWIGNASGRSSPAGVPLHSMRRRSTSRETSTGVTQWRCAAGAQVLEGLGYVLTGQQYAHPANPFTLDFPPGPLMVGDDVITEWDTWEEGDQLLHIISPTDSVRDRLAAYLHWNDATSLEVALAVARQQTIDMNVIEAWCKREGRPERFATFARRLGR